MRKTLIALGLSCLAFAIFSCTNNYSDVLFAEGIYLYRDFKHWLLHKTSDCEAIKNGIQPIDTADLYWENDYYDNGVPVRFCSKCLSDDEIRHYEELRRSQRRRLHQEPAAVDNTAVPDTLAW